MDASRHRVALRLGPWLVIVAGLTLFAGGGCARRGRVQIPPPPEVATEPTPDRQEPEPAVEDGIRLPGQDRYLPSEDPRNRPAGTSTAAAAPSVTGTPGETAPNPEPMRSVMSAPASLPAAAPPPSPVPPGEARYRVQIFASSSSKTAHAIRKEVAAKTGEFASVEEERGIWKVRVGEPMTREKANALRRMMSGMGYHDAFVLEVQLR